VIVIVQIVIAVVALVQAVVQVAVAANINTIISKGEISQDKKIKS